MSLPRGTEVVVFRSPDRGAYWGLGILGISFGLLVTWVGVAGAVAGDMPPGPALGGVLILLGGVAFIRPAHRNRVEVDEAEGCVRIYWGYRQRVCPISAVEALVVADRSPVLLVLAEQEYVVLPITSDPRRARDLEKLAAALAVPIHSDRDWLPSTPGHELGRFFPRNRAEDVGENEAAMAARSHRRSDVVVLRNRVAILVWLGCIVVALGLLFDWFTGGGVTGWAERTGLALVGVAAVAPLIRAALVRVEVGEDGVRVVNFAGTRQFGWDEISDFDLRGRGVGFVFLRDGSFHKLEAIRMNGPRFGRANEAMRQISWLRNQLSGHAVPE